MKKCKAKINIRDFQKGLIYFYENENDKFIVYDNNAEGFRYTKEQFLENFTKGVK